MVLVLQRQGPRNTPSRPSGPPTAGRHMATTRSGPRLLAIYSFNADVMSSSNDNGDCVAL